MESLLETGARFPRMTAAICFGAAAAATTHFAWIPDARMSGRAPLLTLGAGLAHAASGVLMGPRLVDRTRTRTAGDARVLGAVTSLIACALFALAFALWVESSNAVPHGPLSFLAYAPMIAFFSFLAAGWALVLVSIGVAWGLFRLLPRGG